MNHQHPLTHHPLTPPFDMNDEMDTGSWRPPGDVLRDLARAEESTMSLLRLVASVCIAVTLVSATLSLMV